jgi:hypothetical protein
MKNLKKNLLQIVTIFLLSFVAISCSDSDDNVNGTSRVIVKMTDAPGDYDAVFVDVLDVRVKILPTQMSPVGKVSET